MLASLEHSLDRRVSLILTLREELLFLGKELRSSLGSQTLPGSDSVFLHHASLAGLSSGSWSGSKIVSRTCPGYPHRGLHAFTVVKKPREIREVDIAER